MTPARHTSQARRSSGRTRTHSRIEAERASRAIVRAIAARPYHARGASTCIRDQPRDPATDAVRPTTPAPSDTAAPMRMAPSRPSLAAKCSTAQKVRAPVRADPRANASIARPPTAAGTRTRRNDGARDLRSPRTRGGRSSSNAPSPSAAKPGTNRPAPTVTGADATSAPPPRRADRRRLGGG